MQKSGKYSIEEVNYLKNIIDNAKVTLQAAEFTYSKLPGDKKLPEQFKLSNQ